MTSNLREQKRTNRNNKKKREPPKIRNENFLNLVKEIDMQVQEAQKVPIMMDAKRPTPRNIIIKMPMVKQERILNAARDKQLLLTGVSP